MANLVETRLTPSPVEYGHRADAEFAANMEEVLVTYEAPYDVQCPVLRIDEQPVQLVTDARASLPATENHP